MTLYRDMTTPQLVAHAKNWRHADVCVRRILFALASRLDDEARRANTHRDKALAVGNAMLRNHDGQTQWVRVAKPHIKLVRRWDRREGQQSIAMWTCNGWAGGQFYGRSPSHAYQLWRQHLETPIWHRRPAK